MAQINVTPLYLADMRLSIAADNYEKHVSGVTFTPTAPTASWKGGTPDSTFTRTGAATWTCELTYAQDWETANSLSRYLFENQGETVAVEFEPEAGGTSWAANLVITAGTIGGQVDSFGTATVSLGVEGRPVPTFAV